MSARKTLVIASIILMSSSMSSMAARVYVDVPVEVAPPAAKVEVVPAPRTGYNWIPGYWSWENGQYVWVSGRWMQERPNYVWVPEHWEQRDGRWHFERGYWERVG